MSPEAMVAPLDATVENIQSELNYYLYGGLAAAQQVLPDMIGRDSGTLLFTTGGSSKNPLAGPPEFGNIAIATAALRAYAMKLNQVTAGTGVYAAHVPISTWISTEAKSRSSSEGMPGVKPPGIPSLCDHRWISLLS